MAATLEILLADCAKNKRGSQEELYRRFASAMYGLCLQYANNEDDAKDVLQEGFIKVFEKLDQVKNPAAFPGWIRRIMINTALEKYRSQVHLQNVDEIKETIAEPGGNEIFETLACEEVVAVVQTLSPRYRMVFNLFAIEGYTHLEIAAELGISVGTSKSNLSRARAILQKKIEKMSGSALAT